MTVYRCDRCGAEFKTYDELSRRYFKYETEQLWEGELCQGCLNEYESFRITMHRVQKQQLEGEFELFLDFQRNDDAETIHDQQPIADRLE